MRHKVVLTDTEDADRGVMLLINEMHSLLELGRAEGSNLPAMWEDSMSTIFNEYCLIE